MEKLNRLLPPEILTTDKQIAYGKSYKEKRERNPSFKFSWPKIDNKPLNQHLLPVLKAISQEHCFYCDTSPLYLGDETIDHFLSKTIPQYYEFVCTWSNLYLACKHCQDAKWDKDAEGVLRPDGMDYKFEKYFLYDYAKHEIHPNPSINDNLQIIAKNTIDIFQLNHDSKKIARGREYERYFLKIKNQEAIDIDNFAFRFIFN